MNQNVDCTVYVKAKLLLRCWNLSSNPWIVLFPFFFGVPFLFIVVFLTEYFLSKVCAMYRMI